jgi:probable HAF family extracellular repeat protein
MPPGVAFLCRWTYLEAFRWTAQEGMVGLGSLPGGKYDSTAYAVSSNGRIIVGAGCAANGLAEAFRWTAEEGMVGLGWLVPEGLGDSVAFDVSADGSVIVGAAQKNRRNVAFIWDAQHGMRSLSDVLTNEYGLDLNGLTLMEARGVSDDGRTIVGIGYGQDGASQGWVAHIPEPTTGMLLICGAYFLRRRSRA